MSAYFLVSDTKENVWGCKDCVVSKLTTKNEKEKERHKEISNKKTIEGNLKKELGRYGGQASTKVKKEGKKEGERQRERKRERVVKDCLIRKPYLFLHTHTANVSISSPPPFSTSQPFCLSF